MTLLEKAMPNTEPNEKSDTEIAFLKGFEDGMSEGLTQGQNDAWELAKKIDLFDNEERANVFGYLTSEYIKEHYTVQEALAKLKAYEEAQIEVGDVVETTDLIDVFNGVVLDFKDSTDDEVVVFTENGCVDVWKIADCKKTGKHIDLSQIFEQIGE